jgi:hypothetical protein
MADRFLREIRDMHQSRKDIRSSPSVKAEEFMKRLGDDAADDWVFRARDAQLPPPDRCRQATTHYRNGQAKLSSWPSGSVR